MTMQIEAMPVPLRIDEDGAVRVGDSRVLLEIVITAYKSGERPEAIVYSYPTLQLPDVYAVIAYYLVHQPDVDAYMEQVEREGAELRRRIESTPEYQAWRQRLLAARAAAERI